MNILLTKAHIYFKDTDLKPQDLNKLAAKIPMPTNIFVGIIASGLPCVDNVLAFYQATIPHSTPSHHHRYVLVVNLGGRGTVIVDDAFLSPGQNECVLIFPFQFHHYANFVEGNVSLLFITFESQNADVLSPLRSAVISLTQRALRYISEFTQIYITTPSQRDNNQAVLLADLLIAELLGTHRKKVSPISLDRETPIIIKKVANLLFANLDKPMQISDVAGRLGMSGGYLRGIFKKSCGISLGSYMMAARVNRACSLLESTDMTISQIALACGFTSVYSFSRAFKNELSVTPSAYRRKK